MRARKVPPSAGSRNHVRSYTFNNLPMKGKPKRRQDSCRVSMRDFQADTDADRKDDTRLKEARVRQRAIGRQLRGLYDDVVSDGVPDDIDALLDRLDSRTRRPESAD